MRLKALWTGRVIALALGAGGLSAMVFALGLANTDLMLGDSVGRALASAPEMAPTSWASPRNRARQAGIQLSQDTGRGEKLAPTPAALIPAVMTAPLTIGDHIILTSALNIQTLAADRHGPQVQFIVKSVEPIGDDVTRVDTALTSPRLVLITAQSADQAAPKTIRFVIDVDAPYAQPLSRHVNQSL